MVTPALLNIKQVCEITSLSKVTIWRLERAGDFPKRHKISRNRIAWLHTDIQDWIAEKSGGKGK
ncbi:AlpA family phage regulatory protein [Luteithermobacter gelatinilyticus]|uniref:AlpA family phage regulatory protein n=1 Tax=Luteithermobacter gelatinilyticus TaxID=2582913 RepID=UPI0011066B5D